MFRATALLMNFLNNFLPIFNKNDQLPSPWRHHSVILTTPCFAGEVIRGTRDVRVKG